MLRDETGSLIWKPTIKQERYIAVPDTVKEGFYAGAVNAGKTDVLLMIPIVREWYKHPQFKGVFLRRTMPELRNEVIPRAIDYFRPFGGVWKEGKGLFEFESGAMFFMNHVEHEKDVHNYDSMQINYLAFDELTSFTEWMYLYLTIERVRVPKYLEGILPAIVRSASNPGNIGHPFVYKRFIKPWSEGGRILRSDRSGMKRIYIPATIDDNPHASEQYKRELDELPEAERKAKKGGDWTAYEGQVFDEYRDRKYPTEPDNAVHVIPEFDIPEWWPKIVAVDWGFAAMCSIGFGAISPDKRLFVYRHLMFQRKKIEEWAPELKFFTDREKPATIIICHSANQHRGDPHTILEQVTTALGTPVELGEKNRIGGKMLLHEYLRWKQKPQYDAPKEPFDHEFAHWLLRNKGISQYHSYIQSYDETPVIEQNIPRIQFFDKPDVKVIGEAIKACVYERSGADGKKKEDVAEFNGDDPYDMLRMLLHAADRFFNESTSASEQLNKVAAVVQQLETNQDMTAYYRNMRKVENEDGNGERAISRYHGPHRRPHRINQGMLH